MSGLEINYSNTSERHHAAAGRACRGGEGPHARHCRAAVGLCGRDEGGGGSGGCSGCCCGGCVLAGAPGGRRSACGRTGCRARRGPACRRCGWCGRAGEEVTPPVRGGSRCSSCSVWAIRGRATPATGTTSASWSSRRSPSATASGRGAAAFKVLPARGRSAANASFCSCPEPT